MSKNQSKVKAVKRSVSLPADIVAWLDRAAAKRRVSFSHLVKESLLPAFEARRHKEYAN